ncbi:MAG: hypothetical protein DMF58_16915 [Acidobacteria bacterium]|nr:MAG: hypothetical protein DMF58_16915 [Acidobacteriota bacterium]
MFTILFLAAMQFGPDTTSTGVNTGQGVVTAGLKCDPPAGPPREPLVCSGYLASDLDGTMLDATVWVPRTGPAHPLLVGVHGWGGSKRSNAKYAQRITDAGFTFLSYSTRGFGDSFGQTNLADVNVEAVDLRSLIGQVADDPRLHVDPSAVGVFGASYGGAHSFLATLRTTFPSPRGKTVNIRTVVPIVPWSELTGALRPNGRRDSPIDPAGGFKFSFVEGLYIGGCKDAPLCSNYPDYLKEWNAWMIATEPNNTTPVDRQIVDAFSGYRSIYWQNPDPIPIFLVQGWTDDLFPIDEALRIASRYPTALYLGDIGHPRATNKPEEVDFVINQLIAWFQWYLEGAGTQPPFDVQAAITRSKTAPFNPDDVIRVPSYDRLATSNVSYSFSGTQLLTFDPANNSGFVWDPLIMTGSEELAYFPSDVPSDFVPGDVAVYEVPLSQSVLIAGQPTITVTIHQLLPTGFREQIDARLFDLGPDASKSLITRGTYTIDTGDPSQPIGTKSVTVPTYGNLWQTAAGHILRLEITNVDSPYVAPSKIASATEISDVTLMLPLR